MSKTFLRGSLASLLLAHSAIAFGQGMPTTQPALLTIVREEVKVGRAADHQRIEAGWPAAYEKAKSPNYYLALVSITGPSEAWYGVPYASHAALGESMKREDADPVLSAELARLSKADAEVVNNVRVMQAIGRTDLSLGSFPNIATQRFFEITTFRVRPGHDQEFEAVAKSYRAASERASPGRSYRVYQVIAGAIEPLYLVYSSVENYGDFDKGMAAGEATMKAMSPEDMAMLQKFAREGLLNSETQRFRVDPVQSYVDKATRDSDPFWRPKKPVMKTPSQ
jgi:hypothetical protein